MLFQKCLIVCNCIKCACLNLVALVIRVKHNVKDFWLLKKNIFGRKVQHVVPEFKMHQSKEQILLHTTCPHCVQRLAKLLQFQDSC